MNPITTAFCLRSPMKHARRAKPGSSQTPLLFNSIGQRAAVRRSQNGSSPTHRACAFAVQPSHHHPYSDG